MESGWLKAVAERYRVDNVPWPIYPFFITLSYLIGFCYLLYFKLVYLTSRFEVRGTEIFQVLKDRGVILCLWHDSVMSLFCFQCDLRRYSLLNHPYWHMKHIHAALYMMGVHRLILGSTGHDGKKSADELVLDLKQGYSTMMNPDGPDGPPHHIHKGALHIAMQSGLPVIALRFEPRRYFRLNDWDRKFIPLPFNTIQVTISAPIYVTRENFDASAKQLVEGLGEY